MLNCHVGTFTVDISPPVGHPLYGGLMDPVRGQDDPLEAVGVVILGNGAPVVLCALDWCEIRNEAYLKWRQALADAAHTTPERVFVHTVHQHNAPIADIDAEKIIQKNNASSSLDFKYFEKCLAKTAEALKNCMAKTKKINRIGKGYGRVNQVASNRRILGLDGKVKFTRSSATKTPEIRDYPEGLVDPTLRTLSFWFGEKPVVAIHYYATHPISHNGDGMVSADFCGLARRKRQADSPSVFQMYFTGCAGNITPGKYNDGGKENRSILRDRIYLGMADAWKVTYTYPITKLEVRTGQVKLVPRKENEFSREENTRLISDLNETKVNRNAAALKLSWLNRLDKTVDVSCLDLGDAVVLGLPGEAFVEYQLAAQEMRPDLFVCVASHGDGGPGNIPTAKAFIEGGYEPTAAYAAPCEELLTNTIAKVLGPPKAQNTIPFKRFKKKTK